MQTSASSNHSNEAVPAEELVSGFRIAQIYIGISIALPAFLVGAELLGSLGLVRGVIALMLGAIALVLASSLTMRVGAKTRLSTYKIIESVFGLNVAKFINLILAVTLVGWYSVTVSLFAQALDASIQDLVDVRGSIVLYKVIGAIVMALLTLQGFKGLDRLSRLIVPLLSGIMLFAFALIYTSYSPAKLFEPQTLNASIATIGAGASILIGTFMVGVTIAPDIARFAKSSKDGTLASMISYGIGVPAVLFLAGAPVLITGTTNFIGSLVSIGLGWPALFVIVFATLTTNIGNLYSMSLSLGQILPSAPDRTITLWCGVAGGLLSLAGIENYFIPFLLFLSVTVPPIAGIYVTCYLLLRRSSTDRTLKKARWHAPVSWLAGSSVALLTTNTNVVLTSAPAIDSIVVASAIYYLLSRIALFKAPAKVVDGV